MSTKNLLYAALLRSGGGDDDRSDEIRLVSHTFSGTKSFDPKSGVSALGRFTLGSNGNLTEITDTGSPSPAVGSLEWHRDNSVADLGDDWDVRATVTSGLNPPNTNAGIGTWLRINVSRTWGNTRTQGEGIGTDTSTLTLDFRLNGDTEILKTITGIIVRAIVVA